MNFGSPYTPKEETRILLQWLATIEGLSSYELLRIERIPEYDEAAMLEALESGVAIAEALSVMVPSVFYKKDIGYDILDSF